MLRQLQLITVLVALGSPLAMADCLSLWKAPPPLSYFTQSQIYFSASRRQPNQNRRRIVDEGPDGSAPFREDRGGIDYDSVRGNLYDQGVPGGEIEPGDGIVIFGPRQRPRSNGTYEDSQRPTADNPDWTGPVDERPSTGGYDSIQGGFGISLPDSDYGASDVLFNGWESRAH